MEIQWISTVPPIIAEKDAAIKRQASHRMPMGQAAFTALPCGRNPHTVTAGIPIAKVHPASSNLVNAEQRLIDKEAVLVVQDQREVGAGRRAFPREQHCGVMQRQRLAAHMFDGKIKGQDLSVHSHFQRSNLSSFGLSARPPCSLFSASLSS